jgi:hypothetical protein
VTPTVGVEELEEVYILHADPSFLPDKAIEDHLAELESWALESLVLDRRETWRFWVLRGVAFGAAVIAAAAAGFGHGVLAVAGGTLAALATAVEAAWPEAGDREARRRAIHDMRELQHSLKLRWDKVRLAYPDQAAPKRVGHALALLDAVHSKREEIGKYFTHPAPQRTRTLVG